MSTHETATLTELLADYFVVMDGGPAHEELARRLRAIATPSDLAAIDADLDDPLWSVVPQIVQHRFGLDAFKAFGTRHTVGKSFVFVHPAHAHILPQLRQELSARWAVGDALTRELTPRLICALYGGYAWHAAYAAACRHRGDLGQPATILPLAPCSRAQLEDLIAYKNDNRARLAEKIVVDSALLGERMNGIIQAFHCPDAIENTRQLVHLGLADTSDILEPNCG